MNIDGLAELATEIEESLRREGLEDWMICGLLGAALIGNWINLPQRQRIAAIAAHLDAVQSALAAVMAMPPRPGGR